MHVTPYRSHILEYRRSRYRPLHQAWVSRREQRLIAGLLTSFSLRGGRVLDVPCGYGRLFPLYAHLGMTCTGVDFDRDMARLAVRNDDQDGKRHVLRGNILHLPFADESFDAVICIRLLHHHFHHTERHRLFSELARVSRRYVLISYYRFDWLHAWSCFIRWQKRRRVPAIMNETDLDVLLWASGLQMLSTRSLLRYGHMQTLAMLAKTRAPVPNHGLQMSSTPNGSQPGPTAIFQASR